MPETEPSSITFTGEAEAAIARFLSKAERELRAQALDDAVRARGLPAEVTGTDVNKAVAEIRLSPISSRRMIEYRNASVHADPEEYYYLARARMAAEEKEKRSKSPIERVAKIYIVLGVIFGVLGVIFPPLYKLGRGLLSDPIWKLGLGLSGIGVITALAGAAFQSFLQSRGARRVEYIVTTPAEVHVRRPDTPVSPTGSGVR